MTWPFVCLLAIVALWAWAINDLAAIRRKEPSHVDVDNPTPLAEPPLRLVVRAGASPSHAGRDEVRDLHRMFGLPSPERGPAGDRTTLGDQHVTARRLALKRLQEGFRRG